MTCCGRWNLHPRDKRASDPIIGNTTRELSEQFTPQLCCLPSLTLSCFLNSSVAVSTTVETSNPAQELIPGLRILGQILQRFDSVVDLVEPIGDGTADRCFISKTFDGTSHFEDDVKDMLDMYKRITGEDLDMDIDTDLSGDY